MANLAELGDAFIRHYYTVFATNRQAIGTLYQPNSTMCFEGETRIGQQAIIEKLSQLPNMQHEIITKDVLEGVVPGSVLISVTGRFAMEGDLDKPMFFTQTFMLMPLPGNAGYYVQNDIFRRVSIA